MDSRLTLGAVEAMIADRRREADSTQRGASAPAEHRSRPLRATLLERGAVTVRIASPEDARAVDRLAQLDSAPVPAGRALVAEVDGEVVAALPLGGGRPVADPFRPTAELVRLLELRAAQLTRHGRGRRPRLGGLGFGRRRTTPDAAQPRAAER